METSEIIYAGIIRSLYGYLKDFLPSFFFQIRLFDCKQYSSLLSHISTQTTWLRPGNMTFQDCLGAGPGGAIHAVGAVEQLSTDSYMVGRPGVLKSSWNQHERLVLRQHHAASCNKRTGYKLCCTGRLWDASIPNSMNLYPVSSQPRYFFLPFSSENHVLGISSIFGVSMVFGYFPVAGWIW